MDSLTIRDMIISMSCFVFAFGAVLIGIFLMVKGTLDKRKTIWIPAAIALILGVLCIYAGWHFIKL